MRRGNLLTLRRFFNWKSTWCTKYFYKSLLYKDLFLHFYLNSLFFKLRFNMSTININYFNRYISICTFDIYINTFNRLKKYYKFFFKRILIIYKNLKTFLIKESIRNSSKKLKAVTFYNKLDFYYISKKWSSILPIVKPHFLYKHVKIFRSRYNTFIRKKYKKRLNTFYEYPFNINYKKKLQININKTKTNSIFNEIKPTKKKPHYMFNTIKLNNRKKKKKYIFNNIKLNIKKKKYLYNNRKLNKKNYLFNNRKLNKKNYMFNNEVLNTFNKKKNYISSNQKSTSNKRFYSVFYPTNRHIFHKLNNKKINLNLLKRNSYNNRTILHKKNRKRYLHITKKPFWSRNEYVNYIRRKKKIKKLKIIKNHKSYTYPFIFLKYIKELYKFIINKYLKINWNFRIFKFFYKYIINSNNFFEKFTIRYYTSTLYFKNSILILDYPFLFENFLLFSNLFLEKNNQTLNILIYILNNYINTHFKLIKNSMCMLINISIPLKILNIFFLKFKKNTNRYLVGNFFLNSYNKFLKIKNIYSTSIYKKLFLIFNFLKLKINLIKKDYTYKKLTFIKFFFRFKKKLYFLIRFLNKKKHTFIIWLFTKIWVTFFNYVFLRYCLKLKIYNLSYLHNLSFKIKKNNYKFISNFNTINSYSSSIYFYRNIIFLIKLKTILKIFNKELNIVKFKRFFKMIYFNNFMNNLIFLIEKSLYFFNNKNLIYILLPNIFFFHKPFITSAKLLSDYLYFKLRKKLNIFRTYNKIKRWQLAERYLVTRFLWNSIGKFNSPKKKNKYIKFWLRYKKRLKGNLMLQNSISTRIPLKGIRCLCTGPAYKARRKTRNFYHLWIANYSITGSMPLQQLRYKIDYYQTFIVLKRATIGLRIWLLLESYIVLK